MILDQKLAEEFPFSLEALDACCGAGQTIVGLTEIVFVRAVDQKAFKLDAGPSWVVPRLLW